MSIGENILYIRKENKLSQEEFAEKLGVSRQSVSKWELGDSIPEIEKITLICKLFHVSTDSILLDSVDINGSVSKPEVLIGENKFEKVTKAAGKTVKKYFYILGYILITLGIINFIFSAILTVIWNGFSKQLSSFLMNYNIFLSLQFLFWLFVFMAIMAVFTLVIGIFIVVKFKKQKESMRLMI